MSSSVLFKIDKIIRETKDTLSFVLIPLQNERLKYKAGQFLTFLFHFPQGTVRRSYSLSSSPSVDLWPIVTIKVVPNGEISRFIHQYWKVGDTVEALPPSGMFILEKSETPKDIFLLAAGSGITPIFSLINEVLNTPVAHKLHLYYSNLNKEETIFYEQLESLRLKHKERVDVTYFFSESKFLDKARLSKYLLIDLVESSLGYSKEDAVFFVCGPFEYMQMVGIALHSASIQSNQIRKEIFVTNEVELPKFEMADKRTKTVHLQFKGSTYTFHVPYNKSIWDVALDNKVLLPYSCRAGKCSACMAKCTRGEVIMAYNEVLTDRDESNGWVLTCTGHPVSDDVTISYDYEN